MKLSAFWIGAVVIWSIFTFWTFRELCWSSRRLKSAKLRTVVTGGTLSGTVVSALIAPALIDLPVLSYWQEVAAYIVYLLPALMWAVYFGVLWFLSIVENR